MANLARQLGGSLLRITRFLLASVFIFSGGSKLISPTQAVVLARAVLDISESPLVFFVYSISLFEVFLGILLVLDDRFHGIGAFFASVLLLSFIVLLAFLPSNELKCGCFGTFEFFDSVNSALARNVVLMVVSMYLLQKERTQ